MNTYALGDAMSFVPRYPWNDDERDTKTFIEYNSNCIQEEPEYIPAFRIMQEYYKEQQETMYDGWRYPLDYDCDYYEWSDYEVDDSTSTIDYTEPSSDPEVESTNTPDSEDGCIKTTCDDEATSSPYASNKFWYM